MGHLNPRRGSLPFAPSRRPYLAARDPGGFGQKPKSPYRKPSQRQTRHKYAAAPQFSPASGGSALCCCASLCAAGHSHAVVRMPSEHSPAVPFAGTVRIGGAYAPRPACGNGHTGVHSAACFPQRQLTLALPAADAATGLPVAANCFTVNRAGLRCDRIIDVPVGGGVETNFDWL